MHKSEKPPHFFARENYRDTRVFLCFFFRHEFSLVTILVHALCERFELGLVGHESSGSSHLFKLPIRKQQHQVAVDDRSQSVCDGENGAAKELVLDDFLHLGVHDWVDSGSCLVEQNDLGLAEECPAQTQQLSLPYAYILSAVFDIVVQSEFEIHLVEHLLDHPFLEVSEGIQVFFHGSIEDQGVLGDQGDGLAQLLQSQKGDIDAADGDHAGIYFYDSQQGEK